MKCPKCGYLLPDDSEFCQYCGEKLSVQAEESDDVGPSDIEVIANIEGQQLDIDSSPISDKGNTISSLEKSGSVTQTAAPMTLQVESTANASDLTQAKSEATVDVRKKKFCKYCGGPIDLKTKKCTSCGKQFFRFPKRAVGIALLLIVFVALAGLNIYQYVGYNNTIESNASTISNLEQQIETKDATISTQKTTISNQKNEISELENKAGYYDDICNALNSGNIGAASSNFKVSDGVIVIDKGQTKQVTLTTSYSGDSTISVDYSGFSALVSFDEDTWYSTTTLTIDSWFEGVTVATFSNTANSQTFKMVIIVTD